MMVLSKMVLVQVHGNFGRTERQVWSQKMHLLSGMSVGKHGVRSEEKLLAIYALKVTAGWRVYVIAVGTEQLYSIETWYVRASTWYDSASNTIDTGT
jgi:hypothetical protein